MKLPASLMICALAIVTPYTEVDAQTEPKSGDNTGITINPDSNNKTIILTPKTPEKGTRKRGNINIYVTQYADCLYFGITEEMGVCTIFLGERETPVDSFVLAYESLIVNISGIPAGVYPIILVTEGNQIFQGKIEL